MSRPDQSRLIRWVWKERKNGRRRRHSRHRARLDQSRPQALSVLRRNDRSRCVFVDELARL